MNKDFDVYISYAPEDRAQVGNLVRELEHIGLRIWWLDQPLSAQESVDMLKHSLNAGRAQLVVWSRDAAASGRVQAEARIGSELGRLVAVRFESVIPPRGTQAIAYAELTDWQQGTDHRGMQKLFGGLWKLTGKGVRPVEPPPVPAMAVAPDSPVAHMTPEERDHRAWQITVGYNNQTYYENYLKHYPNGRYVEEARQKLNRKKRNWKITLGLVLGFTALYFIIYFGFVIAMAL